MKPNSIAQLAKNFKDVRWRLQNLYSVIDQNGRVTDFKFRPAQQQFIDSLHYFNVILKARQLGFTTLIDLFGLDMTIFTPNMQAAIIAETKEKGADIFQNKILFPYNNLDPQLRNWCKIKSCNASRSGGEIQFSNGSSISVMTSARSGTFQFLHVTEYGVICAKQPAKAKEIKLGSFPAVHAGSFCFVESTAMGRGGYFYELVNAAGKDSLQNKKLSSTQFKLHFYPWHQNPEYVDSNDDIVIPDRLNEYFDNLYKKFNIQLSEPQKNWYALQERTYHEAMWSEFPSYPDEAFKVAQDGAYYARQFNKIYQENRITRVPYEVALPVYTFWDLGVSDDTAIWFIQFIGREVRVIDYYEASGEGLSHYVNVLNNKSYRYGGHFAPHDIEVREFTIGVSRRQAAADLGLAFVTVPTNKDLLGGIEAVRFFLDYAYFDAEKCDAGIQCLEKYKKEWDEKHACYRSAPLHDDASHGADAFRTFAFAAKIGLVPGVGNALNSTSKIRSTGGLHR